MSPQDSRVLLIFPGTGLSMGTVVSAVPEHVSLTFAHTVPSARGAICHFPFQILLMKFYLSSKWY